MDSVSASKQNTRHWLYLAGLLVAVGLVYAQCVHFTILDVWDDGLYVIDNPAAHDWLGATWSQRILTPALGYPLPLPTLLYFLVRRLPGPAVVPTLHGLNLAVHLCGVTAAFYLARRWLQSERFALVAASLWALHPLLAESVAWLANLKTVLFGLLALCTLLMWARQLDRPSVLRAVGTVVLFVLALGSRPGAAALPGLMALRLWMRARSSWRDAKFWAPLTCCVIVVAVYVPTAMIAHHHLVDSSTSTIELYNLGLWARVERILAALWIEVSHAVVPVGLQPLYFPNADVMTTRVACGTVLGVLLIGATVWTWRHDRRAFAGLALFWAFYLPASGIDILPRFTADTYMYLPLLGLTIAASASLDRYADTRDKSRRLWNTALVSVALLLAALSFVQAARWRNPVALFDPVIAESPSAPRPYLVIAESYLRRGHPKLAADYYRRGMTPLYEHGLVSTNMLRAFEQSGSPGHAADLALRLYAPQYPGKVPDGLPAYLTWLLVRYDLPLPKQPAARQIIRRDAIEALPGLAKRWPNAFLDRVAKYFARQGQPDVASKYRRRARTGSPPSRGR